jgi:hypothetical protein
MLSVIKSSLVREMCFTQKTAFDSSSEPTSDTRLTSRQVICEGNGSKLMNELIAELDSMGEMTDSDAAIVKLLKLYHIFSFFNGANGCLDVIETSLDSISSRTKSALIPLIESHMRPVRRRQVAHESSILVSYPGSTSTPELSQLNQDFHLR